MYLMLILKVQTGAWEPRLRLSVPAASAGSSVPTRPRSPVIPPVVMGPQGWASA